MLKPADIPKKMLSEFEKNYNLVVKNDKLFLFVVDHKIEHLNNNFSGADVSLEMANSKYFFDLASAGFSSVFATHLGLISQYGFQYPNLNYFVKLNGGTLLTTKESGSRYSTQLWNVEDVVEFKKNSGFKICGVGQTVFLGGNQRQESEMLSQASQVVTQAHKHGLLATLWIYFYGEQIKNNVDPELIAGAVGVAASLGADFVKVKMPRNEDGQVAYDYLDRILAAAGKTKIIYANGPCSDEDIFLKEIYKGISE